MSSNLSVDCVVPVDSENSDESALHNGFLMVIAVVSLVLDCLLIAVMSRRSASQPDLYLICGFVIANALNSIGLLCASAYRIWWRTAEPLCVPPKQCIVGRFYIPVHMIGSGAVALSMLLLSLERFFLFWRVEWHRVVFKPFGTTVLVVMTFVLSSSEVFAVYVDSSSHSAKLISSLCYRKDYSSKYHNFVYTWLKISLAIVALLFYLLSYVIHKMSIQRAHSSSCLGQLRKARRGSTLNNLLAISSAIAFFHVAPLAMSPFSHWSIALMRGVKILHNLYLPLSVALCMVTHPFLMTNVQRLAAKLPWRLPVPRRKTAIIYIG
uniref:G-protein coupled receptors family 1 profile domain-containing protein n=1 Tax=Trichuris muris TaxID=70415 RepID=A0A5S6Q0F2_TRIMR